MAAYHLSDDVCQRVLSRAHNDLVAKIKVDQALTYLDSVLKKADKDDIQNLVTNGTKCLLLIRRIGKGGVETYKKFKEYLLRDQRDLLNQLEKHEGEIIMECPDNEVVNENTALSENLLARITLKIQHHFDPIAAELRIAEQIVARIKDVYSYSQCEQVYKLLWEWNNQNKSVATMGLLISNLRNCPGISLKLSDFGRQTYQDDADEYRSEVEHDNVVSIFNSRNAESALQDYSNTIKIEMEKDVYDGWLIQLRPVDIDELQKQSEPLPDGGYGAVTITKKEVVVFNTRLAIKQIKKRATYKTHMNAMVIKETFVAKILHFGIVPLIAHHQDTVKDEYVLVSPYLENGDLFDAIQHDTRENGTSVKLNMTSRMKIIYQIFCAIDFIHTRTQDRAPLLHLDIKSKNIVLDGKLNARLTDFGSAAELKKGDVVTVEVQLAGTEGYNMRTVQMEFSRKDDYHGFGVVMRELITGLEVVPKEGKALQQLTEDEVKGQIQRFIWTDRALVEKVIGLSVLCLDAESHYTRIRDKLSTQTEEILRKHSVERWSPLRDGRCERCLVNPALSSAFSGMNHECEFSICCSCLRNSYVNPIKCQTCREEIKPCIGDGWGAILIAGYDKYNTFVEDIRQFAIVATSRVLPSMCIRADHLKTVISENELDTLENIEAKINKALEDLVTKAKVHTLLVYYSGHNDKTNCLQISNECSYDLDLLAKKLHQLMKENKDLKINKTIVFLDCCFPKFVHMFDTSPKKNDQENDATSKKNDMENETIPKKNDTENDTTPKKNDTENDTTPTKNDKENDTNPKTNDKENDTNPKKNDNKNDTTPKKNDTENDTTPKKNDTENDTNPKNNETENDTTHKKNDTENDANVTDGDYDTNAAKNCTNDTKNDTNESNDMNTKNDNYQLIQINACGPNNEAVSTRGDLSFFTKCIIQALTMSAKGGKCTMCNDPSCAINEDYISVERLMVFIRHHAGNNPSKTPRVSLENVSPDDIYLAYNYHFRVEFTFEMHMTQIRSTSKPEYRTVGLPFCLEMSLLKTLLSKEYFECLANMKKFTRTEGSLVNIDVFCIECESGPSIEIENVDDLPRKHCLKFKLRDMGQININKPVAMFLQNVAFIPTQYRQKALSLEEVDAYMETLKKEPEKSFSDALSVVQQRIKDLKLHERRLEIKCETIGIDGASLVFLAIV